MDEPGGCQSPPARLEGRTGLLLDVALIEPRIPPNTGNIIRIAAATGFHLHLVEPLGFSMSDARLRRAGLDYHDLATFTVQPSLEVFWQAVLPARVLAFTASAHVSYADIQYEDGDVLMFGSEPSGLDPTVLNDPRVSERVRIPMLEGRRSLNLANSVALVAYEAWRQHGFNGALF